MPLVIRVTLYTWGEKTDASPYCYRKTSKKRHRVATSGSPRARFRLRLGKWQAGILGRHPEGPAGVVRETGGLTKAGHKIASEKLSLLTERKKNSL